MNEDLIKEIWEQNFKNRVSYSEFRKEFNRPEVRQAIHGEYYSDRVDFDKFETDLGLGQPDQPVQTQNVVEPEEGNFFTRTWDAIKTGWNTGKNLSEGVDALTRGKDIDEAGREGLAQILQQTEKDRASDKSLSAKVARGEKLEGIGEWLGWAGEITAQSLAMMARGLADSLTDGTSAAITAGGAAAGAGGGSLFGGIGAIPGGIAGAMGSVSGMTEASAMYFDELETALKERGLEPTADNIGIVISDEKWLSNVRKKAATKGLVVGTVDGLTGLVAAKIGTKSAARIADQALTGKALRREISRTAAKGLAVEGAGGGGGEALSQVAIGEPVEPMGVAGEILGELLTGGVNVFSPYIGKTNPKIEARAKRNISDKLDTPITQEEKENSEKGLGVGELITAYNKNDVESAIDILADLAVRNDRATFDTGLAVVTESEGLSQEDIQRLGNKFDEAKAIAESFNTEDLINDPQKRSRAVAARMRSNELKAQLSQVQQQQAAADPILQPKYEEQKKELENKIADIDDTLSKVVERKETPVEDDPAFWEKTVAEETQSMKDDWAELRRLQAEIFPLAEEIKNDIFSGSAEEVTGYKGKSDFVTAFDETSSLQYIPEEGAAGASAFSRAIDKLANARIPEQAYERLGNGDKKAGEAKIQKIREYNEQIQKLIRERLDPRSLISRRARINESQAKAEALRKRAEQPVPKTRVQTYRELYNQIPEAQLAEDNIADRIEEHYKSKGISDDVITKLLLYGEKVKTEFKTIMPESAAAFDDAIIDLHRQHDNAMIGRTVIENAIEDKLINDVVSSFTENGIKEEFLDSVKEFFKKELNFGGGFKGLAKLLKRSNFDELKKQLTFDTYKRTNPDVFRGVDEWEDVPIKIRDEISKIVDNSINTFKNKLAEDDLINEQPTLLVPTQPSQVTPGSDALANEFVSELNKAKESNPEQYWSVDDVSLDYAKQGTVVKTKAGYGVVSKDGDIKGVFKSDVKSSEKTGDEVIKAAVKAGGIKLDNFDGYLTKIYERNGFRVVSRIPFDEKAAPRGWNKETHGTPDVVAMIYDPDKKLNIEEKRFNDYQEGLAYRDQFVKDAVKQPSSEKTAKAVAALEKERDKKLTTYTKGERLAKYDEKGNPIEFFSVKKIVKEKGETILTLQTERRGRDLTVKVSSLDNLNIRKPDRDNIVKEYNDKIEALQSGKPENVSSRTFGFFSDVAKGISEKYKPIKEWVPLLSFNNVQQAFKNVYDKFIGNFDLHIATSIPTFRETQIKVGNAITEMFSGKNALVYDIAGSEGGFVKAITEASNGSIKTVNLDPNPDMKNLHEAKPVEGSTFVQEAFYESFEEKGVVYPKHTPTQKADVVHESMGFQFIRPDREEFVAEVKNNYLKPDGLFVTEEKFSQSDPQEYKDNEAKKALYKDEYYTKEQQAMKTDDVLVGMAKNQANVDSYENVLKSNFKFVEQYWDSGNFKGYVASDSETAVKEFLQRVGSTKSEFTTRSLVNNVEKPNTLSTEQAEEKTKTPQTTDEVIKPVEKSELTELSSKLDRGKVVRKLDIRISPAVKNALDVLFARGNKVLAVGGSVRDALLGISPKDVDIEVYNITYDELNEILSQHGKTSLVGKSFGIIKFTDKDGNEYDFSVPRRENKVGTGHTGFEVFVDPSMTPREAAERRDFTWNALAYDFDTNEIHDYFGGIADLHDEVLRHTSDKFSEDPLRVLRAMQFQGRYGFSIHPETMALMRQMVERGDLNGLPKERLKEEWTKWATKSKKPSLIFEFVHGTGLANNTENSILPYIGTLRGVPQDPKWHPEGDVEVHTGYVLDAAVEIADRDGLTGDDRAVLIFSALTHDFAKPPTTKIEVVDGQERITSRGHEEAGGPMARRFLEEQGINPSIIDKVVPLVENHLAHVNIASIPVEKGRKTATRSLARRLGKANIEELLRLIEADTSGRPPIPKGLAEAGKLLQRLAKDLNVTQKAESKLIQGRHLIELGMKPGVEFKPILDAAATAQENGEFTTEEGGKVWLKKHLGLTEPEVVVPEDPAAETDSQVEGRINHETMRILREQVIDKGRVLSEHYSVDDIIKDAYENHMSKDPMSNHVIENGIALDAMAGKALDAPQQVALGNVVYRYAQARTETQTLIDKEKAKSWRDRNDGWIGSLQMKLEEIDRVIDFFTQALHKAGSTAGRALYIRTQFLNFSKYEYDNMVKEARDIMQHFGKELTDEELQQIKELSEGIKAKNSSYSELLAQNKNQMEKLKQKIADLEARSLSKRSGKTKSEGFISKAVKRSKSLNDSLSQLDKVLKGDIC